MSSPPAPRSPDAEPQLGFSQTSYPDGASIKLLAGFGPRSHRICANFLPISHSVTNSGSTARRGASPRVNSPRRWGSPSAPCASWSRAGGTSTPGGPSSTASGLSSSDATCRPAPRSGKRLATLRRHRGMSQRELAALVGVTQPTIVALERRDRGRLVDAGAGARDARGRCLPRGQGAVTGVLHARRELFGQPRVGDPTRTARDPCALSSVGSTSTRAPRGRRGPG